MNTIITDGGKYEISKKVADLLRTFFMTQYESEPFHQCQNKAEQCYGVAKRYINALMSLTRAPAHCWLLCLLYVCGLLSVTASPALGGLTPIQALTGQVSDISHFLHFSFWEPVYYKADEMNLITDSLHNQMRNKDIRLVLLTTRVITLHGRYLLMKQTKS